MYSSWQRTLRQLRQNRAFSLLVIVTLTIAIATSVFSLFDAVFLRPFPYSKSDELVCVRTYKQQLANSFSGASVYDFWDWQKTSQSFTSLAAYSSFHSNLVGSGEPLVIWTTATTPELFATLRIEPAFGRLFSSSENQYRGDVRKIVLSDSLWRQLSSNRAKELRSRREA
jgi:putative ABC transport system permease protein